MPGGPARKGKAVAERTQKPDQWISTDTGVARLALLPKGRRAGPGHRRAASLVEDQVGRDPVRSDRTTGGVPGRRTPVLSRAGVQKGWAMIRNPSVTTSDRPGVVRGPHPKLRSVSAYLRVVKSGHYRQSARVELRSRLGGPWRGMNPRIREYLHDAIFAVMDELESRTSGQSDHPSVVQLCVALNLVKDDLGWNDGASGDA